MVEIEEVFGPKGYLAKKLSTYEYREEQCQMASAIKEAIMKKAHLIVEAGTGVGKSLAYLVPFLYWTVNEKKKAIISTFTKVLQNQLIEKDLPLLREVLPFEFRVEVCFGVNNYLCLRRMHQIRLSGAFGSMHQLNQIEGISKWQTTTQTGLKEELNFEPNPELWNNICREADICFGKQCFYYKKCYYQLARERWRKANLLITNHPLYFANLVNAEMILPSYDALVFDEAHSLEDVATHYLGIEVSNTKVDYLLNRLYNARTGKGFLQKLSSIKEKFIVEVVRAIDETRLASTDFFHNIIKGIGLLTSINKVKEESISLRIREPNFIPNLLLEPLIRIAGRLQDIKRVLKEGEDTLEVEAFINRFHALALETTEILSQKMDKCVYWMETSSPRGRLKVSLHRTPIDLNEVFKRQIFERVAPVILTSATLSTNSSFDYIRSRIGLSLGNELICGSPFDYKHRVLIYLADDLPDPSKEVENFKLAMIERIRDILGEGNVGTFVLFTNFKLLDETYNFLSAIEEDKENQGSGEIFCNVRSSNTSFCGREQWAAEGIKLLKQGDKPIPKLIEAFKKDGHAVLLGTNSFWQGIDVAGTALSLVIITKLPFSVPDEPIIEARMEELIRQEKDPFMNYQVPQAILMMSQGIGRLMRRKTDFGVIAILDPRITSKFYGRYFLNSLPPAHKTNSIKEIGAFFKHWNKK